MNFMKFTIITRKDIHAIEDTYEKILINADQIVSVKPIKIVVEEDVVDGFWIRTTNGKKYRAIDIPEQFKEILGKDSVVNLGNGN